MTRLTKWLSGAIAFWLALVWVRRGLTPSSMQGWSSCVGLSGIALAAAMRSNPAEGWRRWTPSILILGFAMIAAIKDLWPIAPEWIDFGIIGGMAVLGLLSLTFNSATAIGARGSSGAKDGSRIEMSREIAA